MSLFPGRRASNRAPWWQSDKDDAHGDVFASVKRLDDVQSYRRSLNLHHLRMYSNRAASGLTGKSYTQNISDDRLKYNLVRSAIDAAVAHIGTKRPRPMYLTEAGNHSAKVRAKRLGQFVMGQFYATNQYMVSQDVFRNASIFGTGIQKFFEEGGVIGTESIFPDEILVDDEECRTAPPRQLFHHKSVSREVLRAQFPEHKDAINGADVIREDDYSGESISDRVSIVEAWHKASGPDAKDGRHVICISNATLLDEEFTGEFPFAVWRWSKEPLGFWGTGIAEELAPLQVELNYLLGKVQKLMTLATTMWFEQKGSGIARLSNQDFSRNTYKGAPPQVVNVQPVHVQYFQQIESIWAKGFQIIGLSQMHAQSERPAGLNSGTAIRTYHDIGSARFMHVGHRWENYHTREVAERILDQARAVEERGDGDVRVLAAGNKEIEEINFSDVSIERDKYVVKVFPTSLLPDTPQGKLEQIEALAKAVPGIQEHLLELLDVPDLDSVRNRITAGNRLLEKHIEAMVDKGEPMTPLPFMKLEQALQQVTLAILQAEHDGVDENNIELLREYASVIEDMLARAQQPPPQAAPPQVDPSQQQPGEALPPGPMPEGMMG